MNQTLIFFKKECTELKRSGKLMILGILFLFFGVMNPAIAKLTPWLFETLKDNMKAQGIQVIPIKVTALTSWEQFYKNMPLTLIVIAAIFSGILIQEYQKGTLINMLTKGLGRSQVIAAKFLLVCLTWTGCYWMSYGITYGYNSYFWDASIVSHAFLGALGIYVLGIWLLSLIMLASVIGKSIPSVLLMTGGAYGVCYLLSIVPKIQKYLPTSLMGGGELVKGALEVNDFLPAFWVVIPFIVLNYIVAVVLFRKKQL
jgi:ABC-2 type transport system permease protein